MGDGRWTHSAICSANTYNIADTYDEAGMNTFHIAEQYNPIISVSEINADNPGHATHVDWMVVDVLENGRVQVDFML